MSCCSSADNAGSNSSWGTNICLYIPFVTLSILFCTTYWLSTLQETCMDSHRLFQNEHRNVSDLARPDLDSFCSTSERDGCMKDTNPLLR